ncbi:MAG: homoserine O-acetyltransferase/O-succinyltransferase [Actinomycetota bacterium]|nr:homoserine O-acetyltransferase/O-succinyltransferase [Actinomycetota bacterium]
MLRPLLPVTGAWRPGDPAGRRRFVYLGTDRPFVLEGGGAIKDVAITYETWGELNGDASNAVLVCHALTGDSHATGDLEPGHPTAGWWADLIGPGQAIDTDRYFVVCANVLGGCQGSTGPASLVPGTTDRRPYGSSFPVVSIRDMVRSQVAVANDLGVRQWLAVIGGSMGGMQALEWGVMFPERVRSIVALSTAVAASAQQIAWWSTGRRAIHLDPRWRGGDYYDAAPGDGPSEGLGIARMISQITFRSDDVFTERFGREVVEPLDGFALWQRFQVERYLEYHGDKLARRFDANSYLILTKAMDLHDIARGRGSLEAAMARITSPTLVFGTTSDILYPPYQQRQIADLLAVNETPVEYIEIESPHGHDAFLLEDNAVGPPLAEFLTTIEKDEG